ncbi:ABC transporter permease [uncultured Amnibacterium sp.]|uniref:ABC transporter permease n=1 Tax=uncultured Amnibacterium sp. TaxID=1631851 RepID=UPI0035CCA05F
MIRVLALQARRDRLTLTIWLLGFGVLAAGSVGAVGREFGAPTERVQVLRLALSTPTLLALRGAPNGGSLGSLTFFQVFTFLAVVVGLLNTFFVVRHTRADEEAGRRELIAAAPVGRTTPLTATLLLGLLLNVAVAVLGALAFSIAPLGAGAALGVGLTFGATGLTFLAVGLFAAQLAPTGRSANGAGVLLVLLAYALRGAGDALGDPDPQHLTLIPAWPSWLSPIGWGELSYPTTGGTLTPLLLDVALFAVLTASAAFLHDRRDLGASLLRTRPGRAAAAPSLRGPFALALRLQWGAALAWTIGAAVLGAVVGGLVRAVRPAAGLPQVRAVLDSLGGAGGALTTVLVTAMLALVGVLAAAAAVQGVLRLRDEESSGRAEALLARPISRARWLLTGAGVGAGIGLVVVTGATAAMVASLATIGDGTGAVRAIGQGAAELPAVLAIAGGATLLTAGLPRIAVLATWTLTAIAIGVGLFGQLLDLPQGVQNLSPFGAVPVIPTGNWTPSIVCVLAGVALAALAVLAVRRRDLVS